MLTKVSNWYGWYGFPAGHTLREGRMSSLDMDGETNIPFHLAEGVFGHHGVHPTVSQFTGVESDVPYTHVMNTR